MTKPGITGAILAGGQSRRMGFGKALIPWKNKPLIQWVYDSLSEVCSDILIIANKGDYSFLRAWVFPDNFPGNGPAAGIEAALSHSLTESTLIVSCDTPNLNPGLFRFLYSRHGSYDVSICGHDGIDEPLIGLFNRSVHSLFRSAILEGNPRPPGIIRKTNWQVVEISPVLDFYSPDLFLNLNSPEDLAWHGHN